MTREWINSSILKLIIFFKNKGTKKQVREIQFLTLVPITLSAEQPAKQGE